MLLQWCAQTSVLVHKCEHFSTAIFVPSFTLLGTIFGVNSGVKRFHLFMDNSCLNSYKSPFRLKGINHYLHLKMMQMSLMKRSQFHWPRKQYELPARYEFLFRFCDSLAVYFSRASFLTHGVHDEMVTCQDFQLLYETLSLIFSVRPNFPRLSGFYKMYRCYGIVP